MKSADTRQKILTSLMTCLVATVVALAACGGSDADKKGVGAECKAAADCEAIAKTCLTGFKGGYCGPKDCKANSDCPSGSACVTHTDGTNYCFLVSKDKTECNNNRSAGNEANCSSSAILVESTKGTKVCVPPSGA